MPEGKKLNQLEIPELSGEAGRQDNGFWSVLSRHNARTLGLFESSSNRGWEVSRLGQDDGSHPSTPAFRSAITNIR